MDILPKRIYEFGPFHLDPVEHLLQRGSEPVLLTPKALDILLLLVQNSGRILEKDELLRQVWPDTFIEETTLTQNIFTLRRALGETHGKRQYIETVPKKGYRFIANVRVIEGEAGERESRSTQGRTAASVGKLAPERSINSLAVLPLGNASDDPQVEYLADGISESIIKSLAQLPGVRVMARSTVLRYKGLEVNAQEVGREMGVQAVLVGRVLKVGDRLSIRAELVDVANGWHLWGEQYNRPMSHVFEVEQEVAEKISDGLRSKLTTGAPQE